MHSPVAGHNKSNAITQQCKGFQSSQLATIRAKKGNNPGKNRTFASPFSQCLAPIDPIFTPLAAASPGAHLMPSRVHAFPGGSTQHVKCHMLVCRGFHSTQLGAVWANKSNNPTKVQFVPSAFSKCPAPVDPIPSAFAAASLGVYIMPSRAHALPGGRAQHVKHHQSTVERFLFVPNRLVVLKNTVKTLLLRCCPRGGNWNDSLKARVAAGGLALGAMTQIAAASAGERSETLVATNQTAAAEQAVRLGRGPFGAEASGSSEERRCLLYWVSVT